MPSPLAGSPLAYPTQLPLLPATTVRTFGATLVVAPHPDDETLACGGAIALLRHWQLPVSVLVVTDGAASHPRSRRFPPARVAALRQAEARAATALLGVPGDQLTFLGLPDGATPRQGEATFARAVDSTATLLLGAQIRTVLAPWRRDPHRDHRAASAITRAALQTAGSHIRLIEYPVWTWTKAEPGDAPRDGETSAWRLGILPMVARKRAAIRAHRSQITDLIDDDPTGFRLGTADIERFSQEWELYLEVPAA